MSKINLKPLIDHVCLDCGDSFKAPQGSKRNYCPIHLAERVTGKKKRKEAQNG